MIFQETGHYKYMNLSRTLRNDRDLPSRIILAAMAAGTLTVRAMAL